MAMKSGKINLLSGLQSAESGGLTAFCPDDQRIAAWYEHRLASAESDRIARHLADCAHCRGRIGVLGRLEGDDGVESVSDELLARAKQLAGAGNVRKSRAAPAWVAAGVALLALGLYVYNAGHRVAQPGPTWNSDELRSVRSAGPTTMGPEIIRPAPNAVLAPGELDVQWTPVEGSQHYDLQIMDASGGLLLNERLRGTEWRSGGSLDLRPGTEYYLRVTAHLANGRSTASSHTEISVAAKSVKVN